VALVGSLKGSGKITLSDAQLAGLDPRAFDAVTRAIDQGLSIDAERISDVVSKALQSGRLPIKRAQGEVTIAAGQVRLTEFSADSAQARLSLEGSLDLIDGSVEARLVLSGLSEAAGSRPDIFMSLRGPLTEPERNIDVSALTGWLTLRAIEQQAKRLREIERAAPPQTGAMPPASPPSATPAPESKPQAQDVAPIIRPEPAPQSEPQPVAPIVKPQPRREPPRSEATPRAPAAAPKRNQAPSLPPPLEIRPRPEPGGGARPAASAINPQN
jgi:large subunit ribosomal protein L24